MIGKSMINGNNSFYARYIKRALDIACALLALLLLSWLYALVALRVRRELGSPVLFKQLRPGKDERLFNLYKFRSMTNARDENGDLLPDEQRLTKFGRRLRGTSLDELPQLWNVLLGDMSLIGPRPQLVRDMVFMTPEQRRRHEVRPGLSGLAQVSGRNAIDWDAKLQLDLDYINNISFWLDLKIVFQTIRKLIGRDASVEEIDLCDDYGDYLFNEQRIDASYYKEKQAEASVLIASKEKTGEML